MVSVSPRLLDDLETDEEATSFVGLTDPRFAFSSLSLESIGYSDHEYHDDAPAFADLPYSGSVRRKKRERESVGVLEQARPFHFRTRADGDCFRIAILQPGAGSSVVDCRLAWEDAKHPRRGYCCLSYAWESLTRDAAILLDGGRFSVTKNLLRALQSLRNPTVETAIWIDQICINQDDDGERGHQVSIMKQIYNQADEVYVWLGDADDRSEQLCAYSKKMRRGDEPPERVLDRLLSKRELRHAMTRLLQRPWFRRVWVIPEVALSRHTTVVCGDSRMTWDNLVRLVRDTQLHTGPGFHKHVSLLGNPRQRVAIITQIIASQKSGLAHTDITQLLILGKSSRATDVRDMVYAFYALTHLTTFPDYSRSPEELFVEVIRMYVSALLWEQSYANVHYLRDEQKTFQLLSILYSAGKLHQHRQPLPSWIPDWTFAWHLAPIWCRSIPHVVTGSGRDEWTRGVRSDYRAGGAVLGEFEIRAEGRCSPRLRISAWLFDAIVQVNEMTPAATPASTPASSLLVSGACSTRPPSSSPPSSPPPVVVSAPLELVDDADTDPAQLPTLRFGRHFFSSAQGRLGLATPGVAQGDLLAILLGGDVPVVVRPLPEYDADDGCHAFHLLCECFVQSREVMHGDLLSKHRDAVEEIVLV